MMIDKTHLLEAAHVCYADHYARLAEERGESFSGCRIEECVERLPDDVQLPIIMRYIGRIEQAWGHSIGLVFHHMGLEHPDDIEHALCDLMLGCMGHGVAITDDFAEAWDKAAAVLGLKRATPIYFEGSEWDELAYSELGRDE